MREIITIQIGQCGNGIGEEFWKTIGPEHGILGDGSTEKEEGGRRNVYYTHLDQGTWAPRCILVDLDPQSNDKIRSGEIGRLFKPQNFVSGSKGAGNNWAIGHYTDGADLKDKAMDIFRAEAEDCDYLQGFHLVNSMGGGTGCGLGSRLISHMREEYPDRMMMSFANYPSRTSDNIVHPYNVTLGVHQYIENVDFHAVFDNDTLHNICCRVMGNQRPKFQDLNQLVSRVISGTTCSLRFPGQLNCDIRKMCVNLVLYPRLHFFLCGYSPLGSYTTKEQEQEKEKEKEKEKEEEVSFSRVSMQMFEPSNIMCRADPRLGTYLTGACIFRGQGLKMGEIQEDLKKKFGFHTTNWISNTLTVSACDVASGGDNMTKKQEAVVVANNTVVKDMFTDVSRKFTAMFRRKAFLHWYTSEGMDEMEFVEAECNMNDLVAEYMQYEGVNEVEWEGEEDEEEME